MLTINLICGPPARKLSRSEGLPLPIPLWEKPMLQKVVHRKPVAFCPYPHVPDYLLVYVVESLSCGHKVTTYPQADPLIAVRRDCHKCEPKVLQFPSPVYKKRAA